MRDAVRIPVKGRFKITPFGRVRIVGQFAFQRSTPLAGRLPAGCLGACDEYACGKSDGSSLATPASERIQLIAGEVRLNAARTADPTGRQHQPRVDRTELLRWWRRAGITRDGWPGGAVEISA